MVILRRLALLFLLPSLICGQTLVAPPGGAYRYVFEDGREATLMEHFSEVEPFVVHLEMMENTCPHNDLSPSYVMNIPLEKRSISYVWTKHPSRAGDYTAGVYKGSREGAYSLIISPFHRFLWGQLGFDSLGLDREIILRPSRVQSREEIRVHSLSFQADMRNRQFLTSNSTQQFVFQAVGVQLVLDDDGNYRLTETESFGVGRHFNILSVLSSISSVEFVFEDDSSFCEAVFSAIPSRWQGLVFPRDTRFIDVRYLPPSFKEEMTPAVVDKDRDPINASTRDFLRPYTWVIDGRSV